MWLLGGAHAWRSCEALLRLLSGCRQAHASGGVVVLEARVRSSHGATLLRQRGGRAPQGIDGPNACPVSDVWTQVSFTLRARGSLALEKEVGCSPHAASAAKPASPTWKEVEGCEAGDLEPNGAEGCMSSSSSSFQGERRTALLRIAGLVVVGESAWKCAYVASICASNRIRWRLTTSIGLSPSVGHTAV